MTTLRTPNDPWTLVWGQPYVDAAQLVEALREQIGRPDLDFRDRLLIRDALVALESFWGKQRFDSWLARNPAFTPILHEELGEPGFAHLREQLVENVNELQLRQIFDLLGRNVRDKTEMYVAGSVPTLLGHLTARPTTDIDVVDELPAQVRSQIETLEKIEREYHLQLAHVQSHYLPQNWEKRRHFFGDFGNLRVYLVDPYDIFVSKLSSKLEKHRQDLRVMAPKLEKGTILRLLLADGRKFLNDPSLRPQIEENWRFIFQQELPSPH